MARLAGVDIPRDKRVVIALTYIYGVGRTRSNEILTATEIDENIRVKDLSDDPFIPFTTNTAAAASRRVSSSPVSPL